MKKVSTIFTSLATAGAIALGLSLGGCSAMDTAVKKRDLAVETKMSETIFLEPVTADKRVVYFDIRNTSDQEINV